MHIMSIMKEFHVTEEDIQQSLKKGKAVSVASQFLREGNDSGALFVMKNLYKMDI